MNLTSYAEAEAYLASLVDNEKLLGSVTYDTKSFDLENFRRLLRDLGDPHLKYAAVHVAGTKGKGSTCAYLASMLQECGLRVGLFTSPHLERYTERICVNGRAISDETLCRHLAYLSAHSHFDSSSQEGGDSALAIARGTFRTVFELLTATAFLHFAEEEVDIAIIETGVGGRLDSTNVFDTPGAGPLINVITAIGFDHMNLLGHDIPSIAREKAGILRSHGVAVLAPQPAAWAAEVRTVVEQKLGELGHDGYLDVADLVDGREAVEENPANTSSPESSYVEFTLDPEAAPPESTLAQSLVHGVVCRMRMAGLHQVDNVRTAFGVLLALESAPQFREWVDSVVWRRPEAEALTRGLAAEPARRGVSSTRWPGRFEIISRHPLEIVDGAHCPLSATAMGDTYRDLYGVQETILIAGFLRDKDPVALCEPLLDRLSIKAVICCTPPSARALPAEEAMEALAPLFPTTPLEAVDDPEEAVRAVLQLREMDEAVLAFGSLYLVAPVRRALKEQGTVATGEQHGGS